MTKLVIPAPETVSAPIEGTDARFPVRRVYCIGRNYAAHAVEMGHDPDREPPFFFQKNPRQPRFDGEDSPIRRQTSDVHHEIELVVALARAAQNIPLDKALDHVWGYAVGLDMTRRDLQGEAKKMGRPWEIGKAFDGSAPLLGRSCRRRRSGTRRRARIWLKVNGEIEAGGRPEPADLEGPGDDLLPVGLLRAAGRRRHHDRHALGRRRRRARATRWKARRRRGHADRQGRLIPRGAAAVPEAAARLSVLSVRGAGRRSARECARSPSPSPAFSELTAVSRA